jgi:YebC/PmpR family DNA-binding regulatory protein
MEGADVEEICYEGYGPGGIAVMVDCMTNNRNRTVADVRHAFSKHGGHLGTEGSVAYLFKKQGQITFAPAVDEERLMEGALEVGADDIIVNEDKSVDVITMPEQVITIKNALVKAGFHPEQAEVTMIAGTTISITDKETAEKVLNLMDALEDLDDVQAVYSNADIAEKIVNELS